MASLAELQAAFHVREARQAADVQSLRNAKEAAEQEAATLRAQLQAAQPSRPSMAALNEHAVPAPQVPRRHMADMEADIVMQRSLASMGGHTGRPRGMAASSEALPLQPLSLAGRDNVHASLTRPLSPAKQEQPGTEQGGWPPGYLFKFSVRPGREGLAGRLGGAR